MATHSADDGFHEIQLNGKQLVFLFMAATVVSVVIFLCGVLVGRGVRAERGGAIADALSAVPVAASQANPAVSANPVNSGSPGASGSSGPGDAAPSSSTAPPQPPAGTDPRTAAPPPTVDDLTYFNRLEKQKGPPEELKKPSALVAKQASPPKLAPPPPPKELHATSTAEPAGEGFSIQIAALGVRSDADTMAKDLSSKGYSAYVLAPATGAPTVFRVRVGRFNSRREAESVAAKLEKEEHFRPWITR